MTTEPGTTTEYAVHLDREACDGVFACLVRDDRFEEGNDGLATIAADSGTADAASGRHQGDHDTETARFADGGIDDARAAAAACPLDAIEVVDEDGPEDGRA